MSDHHHDESPIDPRILNAAADGCEQSKLLINRRALMGISASLFTWAYMPKISQAATGQDPRLLIVVLRGGMDGLNVAVPTFDPDYFSSRGALALDPATLLTLNGSDYRLNPALTQFRDMYNSGEAAIVQAIAPPLRIRSHFECQYNLETGKNDSQVRAGEEGWLNKLLTSLKAGGSAKVPGLLEVGSAPLIMAGPAEVLAWSPGPAPRSDTFDSLLLNIYNEQDAQLEDLLRTGIMTDDQASAGLRASTAGNLSTLQKAFAGAGYLLGAPTGPRIAALSIEGWDTHFEQGSTLTARLRDLDTSLQALKGAMGRAWTNTVVACVTEFGRTVKPNGTGGTDHGTGTVALLAGGAVAGGQVFGEWPGLKSLVDGRDLRAPNDLRQLFKGLAIDLLGVAPPILEANVFPDSTAAVPMQHLIKSGAGA